MKNNDWRETFRANFTKEGALGPEIHVPQGELYFLYTVEEFISATLEEAVKAEGERIAKRLDNIADNIEFTDSTEHVRFNCFKDAAKIARSHGEVV